MTILTLNGINLYTRYGYYVTKVSNRSFQTIKNETFTPLNISGEKVIKTSYQKKSIQIFGYILDIMNNRRNLLQYLSSLSDKSFELHFGDTQKTIYARMDGDCFDFEAQGGNLYAVTFNVVAFEPYAFGETHTDNLIYPCNSVYSEAPDYLISPLQNFYERINNVDIGHFTIVNFLGVDGNFEDANALQNYWIATQVNCVKNTSEFYFNTKSQSLTATTTSGNHVINYNLARFSAVNHKYFFKAKIYNKVGKVKLSLKNRKTDGSYEESFSGIPNFNTDLWFDNYTSLSLTNLYSAPEFTANIYLTTDLGDVSFTGAGQNSYIDGAMVVDLTNMGDLPATLRKFFNNSSYTTWASLAVTSNITADGRTQTGEAWLNELLNFVDSGATFGATYATNAYTIMIYNKGENIFNADNYTPNYYENGFPVYNFSNVKLLKDNFKSGKVYTIKAKAKNGTLKIYSKNNNTVFVTLTFSATEYENKTYVSTFDIDYIELNGNFDLDSIMIYEGTGERQYQKSLNNYLKINNVAFNYLGISDIIYNDKGTLKKYKRWYYENIVKSTTFPNTTFNGTGTCVLLRSNGEIYFSSITGKSVSASGIPDGTYTVIYQLETSVTETIPYEGDLTLLPGNNHIISNCPVLSFALIGNKKYLEV